MLRHKTMFMALALQGSLAVSALAQNPPNLIFIMTDDQGIDAIEWPLNTRGSDLVRTSVMNALAKQGVSFSQCRMNPNCSPTRAAMMTGRYALDTGVNGVLPRYYNMDEISNPCGADPLDGTVAQVVNRTALQHHERTIAEVLQAKGYYTILVDKWHLGYNEGVNTPEDRGLLPTQQGFDEFYDWKATICDDDPNQIYDEHMVDAYEWAVNAVNNRPWIGEEPMPYALFFHTITPHKRHLDDDELAWWAVDPNLTPYTAEYSTYQGYPNNDLRFLQNLEAIDTVIGMLLVDLEVVDNITGEWPYIAEDPTVVFFTSDNGTDPAVSSFGGGRAKNSLFEGGIRVPLFVMGEDVPGNTSNPIVNNRQISHVDFYNTICHIIGASDEQKNNPLGKYSRRSMSFADSIGWYSGSLPVREFTCSSLGNADTGDQVWRVALVWDHWKLICNSDSNQGDEPPVPDFDDMLNDEFYDLSYVTPNGDEGDNLLAGIMSVEQVAVYNWMRDQLVNHWPGAVSVDESTVPAEYTVEHFAGQVAYVLIGHIVYDENQQAYYYDTEAEEFYDLGVDPNRQNNLVGGQMTPQQAAAYEALHDDLVDRFLDGLASPDVRVIDLPCIATLVVNSDFEVVTDPELTVGHADVQGEDELEYRALLKFDLSDSLPPGFQIGDVTHAQIVVVFDKDSRAFNPNNPDPDYIDRDTDTGLIEVFRQTSPWETNPWSGHGSTPMGQFDPPPHIIATPFNGSPQNRVRVLPMPSGNPISFGHSSSLLTVVQGWHNQSMANYGVLLKAHRLVPSAGNDLLVGDQHLHFARDAVLRLTLVRD